MPLVRVCAIALFLVAVGYSPRAEAVPLLFTYGDTCSTIYALDDAHRTQARETLELGKDVQLDVGYCYSYGGVFWLDIWTWGGKYALYSDKTIWPLTSEQFVEISGAPATALHKPLLFRFPPLLVLLGLFGLFMLWAGYRERQERPLIDAMFADGRYAGVLDILVLASAEQRTDGFDRAVATLVAAGVEDREARRNVRMIMRHLPDLLRQRIATTPTTTPPPPAAPPPA